MKNSDNKGRTSLHMLQSQEVKKQVFDQMINQITSGVWKPGEKIPSENELANIMGVSRISIREAIQKLIAMDLVETYRGKGTFVKEFTTNSYLKSLAPMLLLNKKDILYVVEYRRILEYGIIDLYLKNMEERDIRVLENLLGKMKQYQNTNLKKYSQYDLDFHMKLYEMTGNPFIIKISNMISDILESAMTGAITDLGAAEGVDYHTKMVECIRNRDGEALKRLSDELFDQVEAEVREMQKE